VDDESIREKVVSLSNYKEVMPEDWNVIDNPPYSYWSYYFYSNIVALNQLRKSKGMNPFAFRPH
jgi:AMP deaminase